METEKLLAAQVLGLEKAEAEKILQATGWKIRELEACLPTWGQKSEQPRVIRLQIRSGQAEIVLS